MRKALAIALFISIVLTNTSCNSDKKTVFMNNFVHTYFPNMEIIASIKDGFGYDVTLSDYTQISFDGNLFGKLDWDEVDCRHANTNTTVPAALVPAEITNLVNKLHGSQSIAKIAKDDRGWDIALTNGIELEFDKRFNVVDMDD
jgi:hypothetical protein